MNKDKLVKNNKTYVSGLSKKDFEVPTLSTLVTKKRAPEVVILTCMDARLEPLKYSGLDTGDAHIIRNAGGRASDDVIRSLIISYKLLGTKCWFVIHHTDCGMKTFTNERMSSLLEKSLDTAILTEDGWVDNGSGYTAGSEARYMNFLTIKNLEDSVREDVQRIRNHPLIPDSIELSGFVYDFKTGLLNEVS